MPPNIETPIIIGVGDFVNRSLALDDAHEPLTLILKAIEIALDDTKLSSSARQKLQSAIDSIDVVRTWTWPYDDLPALIGQNLGVNAKHRFYSDHGGNKPAKLLDDAARRISRGKSKVAVVTGGEALASRGSIQRVHPTHINSNQVNSDGMCQSWKNAPSWLDHE